MTDNIMYLILALFVIAILLGVAYGVGKYLS